MMLTATCSFLCAANSLCKVLRWALIETDAKGSVAAGNSAVELSRGVTRVRCVTIQTTSLSTAVLLWKVWTQA